MKEITNEIVVKCLQFMQDTGGEVSRYSFDRHSPLRLITRDSLKEAMEARSRSILIKIEGRDGKVNRKKVSTLLRMKCYFKSKSKSRVK